MFTSLSFVLFSLLTIYSSGVEGQSQLILTGCASKWLTLKCPGDDRLSITEVQVEHPKEKTSPCYDKVPSAANIPKEIAHLCPTKSECIYTANMCEGKTECAFYINAHLISGKINPTASSEVIVKYECIIGPGKTAGVVVLSLLAVIFFIITAGVLVYISRKGKGAAGGFDTFENDTSSVASGPVSKSSSKNVKYSSGSGNITMDSSEM